MLPSQFLQFATSYHLLPSCTCFTWFFDPYVKQSTGMAQAMPSLRGRAHYSLCQPMGGAVCRGLPVSVNSPQFQFPLRVARSTRLCPRRPTSNAQRHHFFEFLSFILSFHHRSAQRFARNKNKNTFRSANSRQAGLLPIVVGPHSGAFDLVPYDAPEELELGRHQFSVWKNLRFSKRWET